MIKRVIEPGEKIKIVKDAGLLYRHGLEAWLDRPEIFDNEYTVRYNSYGYINVEEKDLAGCDIHLDLIKRV